MTTESPPPTPHPNEPDGVIDWRFQALTAPTEWAESYRPGGLHPVNLGDVFDGGRYRVLRKLGYGAFSTVWLARDTRMNQYVALKLCRADATKASHELDIYQHLSTPITNDIVVDENKVPVVELRGFFLHQGPNGSHQCLVLDPMGATASAILENTRPIKPGFYRYPLWLAKSIAKQLLLGLAYLHAREVAHGDLQPVNLLFALDGLDDLEEEALAQPAKHPFISEPLQRKDGKPDKWAPEDLYLDHPLIDFVKLGSKTVVKISDLGSAFRFSNPPKQCETPVSLRAPELVLGDPFDHRVDIWSFGCLLFEFITGQSLFGVLSWSGVPKHQVDDTHFLQFTDVLGPLPPSITMRWPRRTRYFDAEGKLIRSDVEDSEKPASTELFVNPSLEEMFSRHKPSELPVEEEKEIVTLIRKILAWEKEDRPTATQILEEPWFQGIELNKL